MRIISIVIAFLLASCATSIESQLKTLEASQVCCKSVSEFNFEKLNRDNIYTINIDEKSEVYVFSDKKKYFKSFELPSDGKVLHIKSRFNGMYVGQYLNPILLFMNDQHEVVLATGLKMQFVKGQIGVDQNSHMYAETSIPANSSYIVIYGVDHQDNKKLTIPVHGGTYTDGSLYIVTPYSETTVDEENSPTGELDIWITG